MGLTREYSTLEGIDRSTYQEVQDPTDMTIISWYGITDSDKIHHLWESKTNRRIRTETPFFREKKKKRTCVKKGLGRPLQIA